jgi:hypothetical protein
MEDDISERRQFVEDACVDPEHPADAFKSADPKLLLRIRLDGDLGDVPPRGAKELAAGSTCAGVGASR